MADTVAAVLWQRLDVDGHDACRLDRAADGWFLKGGAVFDQEGEPCVLSYGVACDAEWRTRRAVVSGWIGGEEVALEILRSQGDDWSLNGAAQPLPAGCLDIDLGFTPATNLLAIRRFALAVGRETPAPAAYLSFPDLKLERLEQNYRRSAEDTYAYAAPAFGYAAELTVSPTGFVTDYPGLWRGSEVGLQGS